jgi:hypothetical protein
MVKIGDIIMVDGDEWEIIGRDGLVCWWIKNLATGRREVFWCADMSAFTLRETTINVTAEGPLIEPFATTQDLDRHAATVIWDGLTIKFDPSLKPGEVRLEFAKGYCTTVGGVHDGLHEWCAFCTNWREIAPIGTCAAIRPWGVHAGLHPFCGSCKNWQRSAVEP